MKIPLPIDSRLSEIKQSLHLESRLILTAPPGTGKSTRVPPLFLDRPGQIWVLQPRRIAARSLAARVAQELECKLGSTVGYQVRFENCIQADTQLIYMTYGVFLQKMLTQPTLSEVQLVILDEFHERALECDAALALLLDMQKQGSALKMLVMSATLEAASLISYLHPAVSIDIHAPHFPVEIIYVPPLAQERPLDTLIRVLKSFKFSDSTGSVLVFLPGQGEIRRLRQVLEEERVDKTYRLLELHGSLDLEIQQEVIQAPLKQKCLILSTNIAETSLTLPGVSCVVDSGLHRVAAYDPSRDMNTLYLQGISQFSAIQRAGRAGRTGPGKCIRVWNQERQQNLPLSWEPEIQRVDLMALVLKMYSLAGLRAKAGHLPYVWYQAPAAGLWKKSHEGLKQIQAIDTRGITPLGKELSHWPIHPIAAFVLYTARPSPTVFLGVAAVLALREKIPKGTGSKSLDVFSEALDLVRGKRVDKEVRQAYEQYISLGGYRETQISHAQSELNRLELDQKICDSIHTCFLKGYVDRLAVRQTEGQIYILGDGRRARLVGSGDEEAPSLLLALELHEQGGAGKSRSTTLPLFYPLPFALLESVYSGEFLSQEMEILDATQGRLVKVKQTSFRGLILQSQPLTEDAESFQNLLVEKLLSRDLLLPLSEEAQQFLYRVKWAGQICADQGFPVWTEEDWHLIYTEVAGSIKSFKELETLDVLPLLQDYLGYTWLTWLSKESPVLYTLPQGIKKAKITYFDDSAPEIAARLGDFLGCEGRFMILLGRLSVTYNILAPNYRTVQKTTDISSFWQNTYPEVKKELKRRYPRHPWP